MKKRGGLSIAAYGFQFTTTIIFATCVDEFAAGVLRLPILICAFSWNLLPICCLCLSLLVISCLVCFATWHHQTGVHAHVNSSLVAPGGNASSVPLETFDEPLSSSSSSSSSWVSVCQIHCPGVPPHVLCCHMTRQAVQVSLPWQLVVVEFELLHRAPATQLK